jgi:hypothetical protein
MTIQQARWRIEKANGRSPSAETIARWAGVDHVTCTKRTPSPLELLEPADEPDSYERAWAAADGLDGAAWADAVMRAWFGEDRCQASEPDVRVLTRRAAA